MTATGGTVEFQKSVNGDTASATRALTVNATTTTFTKSVGTGADEILGNTDDRPLLSLTTDATGATTLNGGAVKATTQTYKDDVTVGANTTFSGTAVKFEDTLNPDTSTRTLSVTATGATTFQGNVGGVTPFTSLTTDTGGTTTIGSSGGAALL